jgi:hypothetical protein
MDIQDEERASMTGMIERLRRRVTRLEEAWLADRSDAEVVEGGSSEATQAEAPARPKSPFQESPRSDSSSEPSWHDGPPEPGVYIRAYERGKPEVARILAPAALDIPESETFYGPIPEKEGTGLETYV